MRICKTCETRYWRLHTWDECIGALRAREERERVADVARREFTQIVQDIFSRA